MFSKMKMSVFCVVLCQLVLGYDCSLGSQSDSGGVGYYRLPAINDSIIVFVAEGDLWRVSHNGGVAHRLTSHPDEELYPSISIDGKWLAFTAKYEGSQDAYVMPITGGIPRRLTYYGSKTVVSGWTPDGRVLCSTPHYNRLDYPQLVTIDHESGDYELIPLSQAAQGCFDESGETFFFTRLPFQGSYTKRYHGGSVEKIWKYQKNADEAVPLTGEYTGTDRSAMWHNDRVYFISDRDGTMNIWSMDESGQDYKQHTNYIGWDVKSPSLSMGRIVYQLGADLYLYTIPSDTITKLSITLASDFDHMRENWVKNPMEYLSSARLSSTGEQVALTSRGKVFVVDVETGKISEISGQDGIRYRDARFMPDDSSLIALSDETGEFEYWLLSIHESNDKRQLTKNESCLRFDGQPSPDGKKIAYYDKEEKLWIYEIESSRYTLVDSAVTWGIFTISWSPDSRWLSYGNYAENLLAQLFVYDSKENKKYAITTDRYDNSFPTWSSDGEWLYFLSNRQFESVINSPWVSRQPFPAFDKPTKIFLLPLKGMKPSPFTFEGATKLDDKANKDGDKKDKGNEVQVAVEFKHDGVFDRLMEVPIPNGNYTALSINDKQIFWLAYDIDNPAKKKLQTVEIKWKDREVKTLMDDIKSYELSNNGAKLMVHKGNSIFVLEAGTTAPDDIKKHKLDLTEWSFSVDPRSEWRQMFIDAWRMERDYFYDPNMHGVDWEALLNKYLPLVDRVTDRSELNDLISELVGELSALHIYVRGGDFRKGDDNIELSSLGAILQKNKSEGGYIVEYVYQADPDEPTEKSPLLMAYPAVNRGDIIQEVNGVDVLTVPNINMLLRNQIGKFVQLRVKSPDRDTIFNTNVRTISVREARDLRFDDWEYSRRLIVEEEGNGDLAYIHLRAMEKSDYSQWVRDYFPIIRKKGLILDMRHNYGGNIDSWILTSLLRKPWAFWKGRTGQPYPNMQRSFGGHMVVLVDEWTSSDGECFAEGFRRLGMGKIIGRRTWGGEIWLSYNNPLVDKGIASAAQYGLYAPEGVWLIEGHGVEPDIMVDNLPHETFEGRDAQLETAINYLKKQIELSPVEIPLPPPYPDKSYPEGERAEPIGVN